MKKLLILALFFFTLTSYSQTVVVCNGNYAYSWHSTPNCRGLSNCLGGLYNVDLSYAVYTMNRGGCCICTNDPNCLTDRTDPAYVPSPVPFQPDWEFLEYAQQTLSARYQEYYKEQIFKLDAAIAFTNSVRDLLLDKLIDTEDTQLKNDALKKIHQWNDGLNTIYSTPIGTLVEETNFQKIMKYIEDNREIFVFYIGKANKLN